jgi:hypothetical protein
MIARSEAQVLRLAAIYALLNESTTVTEDDLRAALQIWRYCEHSARFLFSERLGDPTADVIVSALRQTPGGRPEPGRDLGPLQPQQARQRDQPVADGHGTPRDCCQEHQRRTSGDARRSAGRCVETFRFFRFFVLAPLLSFSARSSPPSLVLRKNELNEKASRTSPARLPTIGAPSGIPRGSVR